MMPTAGLLIALFVGWRMQRAHVEDEIALSAGSFQTVVRRAALPVAGGDRAHLPERDRGDRLRFHKGAWPAPVST